MVCTANDLLGWSDFPKGLRVLLLDENSNSSDEIKSKLEKMDYIVSSFWEENEALAAISNRSDSFHAAIVEVSTDNSHGRFKFLEAAKELPTIMISNIQCLSTMMRCIALGAVEFLVKPLSDDKLKNLWQHVVHKAFNAGGKNIPESLKPIKESVCSMLSSPSVKDQKKSNLSVKTEENNHENSVVSDKCPSPPTPQLKQGARLVDDGDCPNQTNSSTERETADQDKEPKFVDNTSGNVADDVTTQASQPPNSGENIVKDEDRGLDISKSESNVSSKPNHKNCQEISSVPNSYGKKANRKKMKVDWTPNLHKKFVQAVEQLGADQAIPSRILELMKVEGLTRHNIASHLQKYRIQHRHILPKEDDRRWSQRRDLSQRSYYPHTPIMAYPPYHSTTLQNGLVHPTWVPHGSYPSGFHMWGPAYYPPWKPAESWQPYPGMHAEAWGCPVMPPLRGSCQPSPQNVDDFCNANVVNGSYRAPQDLFDLYPAEEEIDRVVEEAISKPWLPLPIGLKPPSTDSVLTELAKQGIPTVHPCHVTNHL